MTEREISELLVINQATYPYAYKEMSQVERGNLRGVWLTLFREYDGALVTHAFKEALKTCKYPVTPSDVFTQLDKMKNAVQPSDDQLWLEFLGGARLVYRASGYCPHRGAIVTTQTKAQFENLPLEIREFAGNARSMLSYHQMGNEELTQFIKPQFLKRITLIRERANILSSTPRQLLNLSKNLFKQIHDSNETLLDFEGVQFE